MRKPRTTAHDELVEDADSALRSLSRRFPEALAELVLRPGEQIESAEWLETQVVVRQLRMDRVLRVRLAGGEERLIHGEWTERLNRQVERRLGEYHLSVAVAERVDAETAGKFAEGDRDRRGLESIVVVLRGRKKRWPKLGKYRTTPRNSRFGGAWFHIEPVYQRTVAELEARGSVFWLAFVPVAIDADEEKLMRVISRLRNELDQEHFDELIGAMTAIAKLKKDSQRFISVIQSNSSKEVPMNPFVRLALDEGIVFGWQQGLEQGLVRGRKQGLEQGLEKGRKQERARSLSMLQRILERRLGRPLTDKEHQRINKRFNKEGPESIGDVVGDLSPEQLAAWLAPRKRKT